MGKKTTWPTIWAVLALGRTPARTNVFSSTVPVTVVLGQTQVEDDPGREEQEHDANRGHD